MRAQEFVQEGITAAYPRIASIHDYIRNNLQRVASEASFYSENFDSVYQPNAMKNRLTDDQGNVFDVGFVYSDNFPSFSRHNNLVIINVKRYWKYRGMFNREQTTTSILDVMSNPPESNHNFKINNIKEQDNGRSDGTPVITDPWMV